MQIETEGKPITNQKSTGRCWIFACLNVIRIPFMKKYNVEDFEFSQAFIFFWDKVSEITNLFYALCLFTVQVHSNEKIFMGGKNIVLKSQLLNVQVYQWSRNFNLFDGKMEIFPNRVHTRINFLEHFLPLTNVFKLLFMWFSYHNDNNYVSHPNFFEYHNNMLSQHHLSLSSLSNQITEYWRYESLWKRSHFTWIIILWHLNFENVSNVYFQILIMYFILRYRSNEVIIF